MVLFAVVLVLLIAGAALLVYSTFESRRKPYIVNCTKIGLRHRDVYRRHATGYMEIDGGEDFDPDGSRVAKVGESVYYKVNLTRKGLKEFKKASNLLYIEDDTVAHAVGDASPFAMDTGVEASVLNYHGLFSMGSKGADGRGVIVAVGDTGVDGKYLSPDLKSRYIASWSWFNDNGMDRQGHGTWCVGAAVPSGARWISGKVLGDNGSGSSSGIIAFIRKAAKYISDEGRAGVISLSLGSSGPVSLAYQDAIRYANSLGVSVVCAAGNNGPDGKPGPPGNSPDAVQVGAVDHRNSRVASFSSRPLKKRSCAAAGVNVLGVRGMMSGTSMATPIVARVLACLLSSPAAKGKNEHDVEMCLLSTASREGNTESQVGYGIVDGALALKRLEGL